MMNTNNNKLTRREFLKRCTRYSLFGILLSVTGFSIIKKEKNKTCPKTDYDPQLDNCKQCLINSTCKIAVIKK